ncbi:glycerol kinase GlpK [Fimbriimonas ginsengisoli]|uniref:Glycerol kinase n=1 Tax=Fimbriimonas ginsengisoli Gsoil 348 TaxID=661478 RepID=A0A068NPS6_FIMGI|nr:glycerol kinase GlpK [Fimbriimonas ginsengisoli]AIE83569.1 glycerol kinase [Fimbriimonas ginsengisoli Gsoil 348]
MSRYILALDQGTTSSRAILFDRGGSPIATGQRELPQHYPHLSWVEHDPEEIWETQIQAAKEAIAKAGASADDIEAIGIANQRETTLLWDRRTGIPVYPAIVWQDRRTSDRCEELKAQGLENTYIARTGLLFDSYFSATKIEWILNNVRNARKRAEAGELAFGTVDSYLIWRLTGGKVHATDLTNASRTLIFHIDMLDWSEKLMSFLDLPKGILADIVPSTGIIGYTDPEIFGKPIPIAGVAGDQQAALYGQAGFRPGVAKATYGTGCFLLRHIGEQAVISENRILTTPVACTDIENASYAFEGSVFNAGSAIQWLRDGLGILSSADESEAVARTVKDNEGVYMVPAFTGLGAPYWDPDARAAIVGLTRGSTRAHVVRAALESIAYQCKDVLEAMDEECEVPLRELRVDGGASRNDFLMQFQANILGIPVVRPKVTETTALGAAYLAGLAVGFWSSEEELESLWKIDRRFEPEMDESERESLHFMWQEAVGQVRVSSPDFDVDEDELGDDWA